MITVMTKILIGSSGVLFLAGKGTFLFSKTSYSRTRPSPHSRLTSALFPEIIQPERKAKHSPPSSAEGKKRQRSYSRTRPSPHSRLKRALFSEIIQPERKAKHSPPSSSEGKKRQGSYSRTRSSPHSS